MLGGTPLQRPHTVLECVLQRDARVYTYRMVRFDDAADGIAEDLPPIVLLHGFSEDHRTWEQLRVPGYTMYAVDLIGHGLSDVPLETAPYVGEQMVQDLHEVLQRLVGDRYILCGYSMGARMALWYAMRYPKSVIRLLLESGSFGIADVAERRLRREKDATLATAIVEKGIRWFADIWAQVPIFETQRDLPIVVQREIWERRAGNRAIGLAQTLRGTGQGVYPYWGEQLDALEMPVFYLAGARDTKYAAIGNVFQERCPQLQLTIVEGAGHNVHLERVVEHAQWIQFACSSGTLCR